MEYKIEETSTSIRYIFELSRVEIACANLSKATLDYIMQLEKTPNIANQLEILVEYFHVLEGTDRATSLARYMRVIQHLHNFQIGNPSYAGSTAGFGATNWFQKK